MDKKPPSKKKKPEIDWQMVSISFISNLISGTLTGLIVWALTRH